MIILYNIANTKIHQRINILLFECKISQIKSFNQQLQQANTQG